jgi:predicted dehydrogenase
MQEFATLGRMTSKIRVGVAGLGMMGQMHLGFYARNSICEVVAVADRNASKRSGEETVSGNIANPNAVDLSGVRGYQTVEELIADPDVDMLDLCLPTSRHAEVTIAALRAGKHVLCEKPMALTVEECDAMIEAQRESGKFLMIAHCLRFWPQYVKAHELISSGELGAPRYARLYRSGDAPTWSKWLLNPALSGGVTLDMHIHDIDVALWYFGKPDEVTARGYSKGDLVMQAESLWHYENGLTVSLHAGWDENGSDYQMGYEIICENGTLRWNSDAGEPIALWQNNEKKLVEVTPVAGYEAEVNYFIDCIAKGEAPTRVTPEGSRLAVEMALIR